MIQKVIKAGNSLAVTLPSQFVKTVGILSGDDVKVLLKPENGKIVYTFKGTKQLSLLGK
jgi:antitoxin component of MazEF toxin-antitoxin module